MTVRYEHTQIGYAILCAMGGALLVILILLEVRGFRNAAAPVSAVLAVCACLFATLTVAVDEDLVRIRFGPGVIRKQIPVVDLVSCTVVTNPWYAGWGIHRMTGGWVYNVSGRKAVEVRMRNGRAFRIGTDDPEGLACAIRGAVLKKQGEL